MNRIIKFRGKRIDTGEWVYGDLCTQHHYYESLIGVWNRDTHECDWVPVDPVTVGQFTGLHDKDGKEIYDGDVVKCQQGCPHIVAFVEDNGGTYFGGMPGFNLMGLGRNGGIGYAWSQEEELIGNIHDNPELIESK